LEKDEIEKAVELESYFGKVGYAQKSETLEEAKRCRILGVDSGDHAVFA
jgi:hypothetical protein